MRKGIILALSAVLVLALFTVPANAAASKTEPVEIIETRYEGENTDWTESPGTVTPTREVASSIIGVPAEQTEVLWTKDYNTEKYPAEVTISASGMSGVPLYVLAYTDDGWTVIGTGTGPEITAMVQQGGTLAVVAEIPIQYRVTEGMAGVWYQTTTAALPFTCVRNIDDPSAYSRFTGIEVDGETIDPSCYTAVPGSVVLELHPEYLSTLELGEHQLMYRFNDGQAGTNFFVRPIADKNSYPDKDTGAKAPQTGDDGSLFAAGAIVLAAVFAASVWIRRKEH